MSGIEMAFISNSLSSLCNQRCNFFLQRELIRKVKINNGDSIH